jgi:hypothetical protein
MYYIHIATSLGKFAASDYIAPKLPSMTGAVVMDSACSKIPVQLRHGYVAAPTVLLDYKMTGPNALV